MGVYATADDLADYAAGDPEALLPPTDEEIEALLSRAERVVDLVLGPIPRDEATGRKLDPADLTDAQRDALSRATCAAALHELALTRAVVEGRDSEYTPSEVREVIGVTAFPPTQTLRELAGYDLIRTSGTVTTTTTDAAA
jgi:hypothetical protein